MIYEISFFSQFWSLPNQYRRMVCMLYRNGPARNVWLCSVTYKIATPNPAPASPSVPQMCFSITYTYITDQTTPILCLPLHQEAIRLFNHIIKPLTSGQGNLNVNETHCRQKSEKETHQLGENWPPMSGLALSLTFIYRICFNSCEEWIQIIHGGMVRGGSGYYIIKAIII